MFVVHPMSPRRSAGWVWIYTQETLRSFSEAPLLVVVIFGAAAGAVGARAVGTGAAGRRAGRGLLIVVRHLDGWLGTEAGSGRLRVWVRGFPGDVRRLRVWMREYLWKMKTLGLLL
jgi:hypothetical protein